MQYFDKTHKVININSLLGKKLTSGYMAVLFISIGWMPFLVSTHDYADTPFALVIPSSFYLHNVEMADRNPSSGSL